MQSIAISIVRNCRDLITLSVLHHVLMGVDRCVVIDNGSTDGTTELLYAIAKRLPAVDVRSDPSDFRQAEMLNAVINEFTCRQRTLVIPFDCDEFWDATAGTMLQFMEGAAVNVLSSRVVNFVQSRSVVTPTRLSWLRAFRTMPVSYPNDKSGVFERNCSFIESEIPRKVAFCAAGEVAIGMGAHDVQMAESKLAVCEEFCCLHLPLRSKAELAKRAFDHEPRWQSYRTHPDQSWQSTYIQAAMNRNEGEAEWRANSYDRSGMIDVFGRRRPTRIDLRLLRRMARAYAYGLYLRIPMGPQAT